METIEQTLDLCRWLYNSMLEQRKQRCFIPLNYKSKP
ncbi:helix-turn-helix domain-containing protein [Thermoactinomyces sp. AMNI-1]|uniref:Helix-turn-helix domain-containing protein n=1 Tax=Thermoactinomyces mirandus TaxID=2756294 RepID=A0A7W1XS03_9BACL|nr:helix-turn-helix domain-containing protein [Thermoactinomyces mirandus]